MRLISLLMTIIATPRTISMLQCVKRWIMPYSWLATRENPQVVFLNGNIYYVMPTLSKSIIFLLKLLKILRLIFQQQPHLHSTSHLAQWKCKQYTHIKEFHSYTSTKCTTLVNTCSPSVPIHTGNLTNNAKICQVVHCAQPDIIPKSKRQGLKLTRHKLMDLDDWSNWNLSEHKHLN